MTKYREILRLSSLGFSNRSIALSVPCSRNTVAKVLKRAQELDVSWPLEDTQTDEVLEGLLYPKQCDRSQKRMPDYAYIHKELLRNGVSKKLLWTEYMEDCRANGDEPLMYSQFCYHIQQDEQKRRATMHINRKPGEQVEVDWAGDPATIIDPDTGESLKAYIFVGVMTYSQYAYVEAFLDMKQKSWITAHVHMYEFFGGVARILVPDNCRTAVVHNGGWKDQQINETYQEMAEHYGTAIIPARVRTPKDKPNTEGTVGNISTWITAALRNEQFFSLAELNCAIREKLEQWLKHATDVLIRYLKWIQFWKEIYQPEPDEEWHELFTEALANERKINDYLDVLMFGTGEEIVEFFKMKRREVEKIEKRINEYQREVLDGIRRYCERGNAYNRRCQ